MFFIKKIFNLCLDDPESLQYNSFISIFAQFQPQISAFTKLYPFPILSLFQHILIRCAQLELEFMVSLIFLLRTLSRFHGFL